MLWESGFTFSFLAGPGKKSLMKPFYSFGWFVQERRLEHVHERSLFCCVLRYNNLRSSWSVRSQKAGCPTSQYVLWCSLNCFHRRIRGHSSLHCFDHLLPWQCPNRAFYRCRVRSCLERVFQGSSSTCPDFLLVLCIAQPWIIWPIHAQSRSQALFGQASEAFE